MLSKGKTLTTMKAGAKLEIGELLASGGQGEVYLAKRSGNEYALKWYYPDYATQEQLMNLEKLVELGAPSGKFLWPLDLVDSGGLGYIMPLRENNFEKLNQLMSGNIEPSFRALCTAGFELAHNFLLLHAQGLAYKDISLNNIFIEPNTGDIRICDNDNVVFEGEGKTLVLGTPRFMAPEIVRGEALPSTDTDLFSLATVLFHIFFISHPLEGRREAEIHCVNMAAMQKLHGFEPVFIFDPDDDSNRPVPGIHDAALVFWAIYPEFIREMFTRAFTIGLHNPKERVAESEWRQALVRLRDLICYCPKCGAENFFDPNTQIVPDCWRCKNKINPPMRLKLDKSIIVLNHDTQLYPHHLDGERRYDFDKPLAKISRHPKNPHIWGLTNMSQNKWVITNADGKMTEVQSTKTATLFSGMKIHFGKMTGEVI